MDKGLGAAEAAKKHVHTILHWPTAAVGYGACECGATMRVEMGKAIGQWHACKACSLETA